MRELNRYKWDIIGLAETRLQGNGGLTWFYDKKGDNVVLNYIAISSRIISIRIKTNPLYI